MAKYRELHIVLPLVIDSGAQKLVGVLVRVKLHIQRESIGFRVFGVAAALVA